MVDLGSNTAAAVSATPPTTQLLPTMPDSTKMQSQRPTRLYQSQPSVSTPRQRTARRERNSLHGILQQHSGTSLFVRPICWTDLHSQLLGAQFTELPPCDMPLPTAIPGSPPSKGHLRPSQTITTLSNALSEILLPATAHPILSCNAIRTILSILWPAAFSKSQLMPELHMFFGNRVYRDAVRTQIMWNFPSPNSQSSSQSSFKSISTRPADSYCTFSSSAGSHNPANLPMVCYVGKGQLASVRKNLFRIIPGPGRSRNEPVHQLQQIRAKMLAPANSDHDVHFVGIFIAMAQRHFYGTPPPSSKRDSQWSPSRGKPPHVQFYDIKLRILTHDNDTAEFIVYTGYITASFLKRFHHPFNAPTSDGGPGLPGIKIEYTRVPIWPILGLRERLGRALGEEVVGQFDMHQMETWEEDEIPEDLGNGGKRKREALSEVFNESFHESSDDEQSSMPEKKRCLGEGVPVGVVA